MDYLELKREYLHKVGGIKNMYIPLSKEEQAKLDTREDLIKIHNCYFTHKAGNRYLNLYHSFKDNVVQYLKIDSEFRKTFWEPINSKN